MIFAYHGYPYLIHRLTYNRTNHADMHVRGFEEEGTTTTPFDMVVLNELDRYHLAIEAIERVPGLVRRGRARQAAIPRHADRARALCPRTWRRHAGNSRLGLAEEPRRPGCCRQMSPRSMGQFSSRLQFRRV